MKEIDIGILQNELNSGLTDWTGSEPFPTHFTQSSEKVSRTRPREKSK